MNLPVVANAFAETRAPAAVIVELSRVKAGVSLAYTGDICAPFIALLGKNSLKSKRTVKSESVVNTPTEVLKLDISNTF